MRYKFPCKDCITLVMCIGIYNLIHDNTIRTILNHDKLASALSRKCSLMRVYIDEPKTIGERLKRLKGVYRYFFKVSKRKNNE